jgi:hypothetical protein
MRGSGSRIFPAAPSFFKFSGAGIVWVRAFAFGAMTAIQFERQASFDARCTPLHAEDYRRREVIENSVTTIYHAK